MNICLDNYRFHSWTIPITQVIFRIMHDRFSIILNIMCGNMGHFHKLLDILGIVNNVIVHDINIAIPIRSKMFMVDTKWMQNLMDDFSRCITIFFTVHLILGQPNVLFASLPSCDTPTSFPISYISYLDIIFFRLPWAVKFVCFYLLWCKSNMYGYEQNSENYPMQQHYNWDEQDQTRLMWLNKIAYFYAEIILRM